MRLDLPPSLQARWWLVRDGETHTLAIAVKAALRLVDGGVATFDRASPFEWMDLGVRKERCDVVIHGASPAAGTLVVRRAGRALCEKHGADRWGPMLHTDAARRSLLPRGVHPPDLGADEIAIDQVPVEYFQCAPADQRTEELHGGEVIEVRGLVPRTDDREDGATSADLVTRLPALGHRCRVGAPDGSFNWVVLVCDTLILDLRKLTAAVVLRGETILPASDALHSSIVVRASSDGEEAWPGYKGVREHSTRRRAIASDASGPASTIPLSQGAAKAAALRAATPFRGRPPGGWPAGAPRVAHTPWDPLRDERPRRAAVFDRGPVSTTMALDGDAGRRIFVEEPTFVAPSTRDDSVTRPRRRPEVTVDTPPAPTPDPERRVAPPAPVDAPDAAPSGASEVRPDVAPAILEMLPLEATASLAAELAFAPALRHATLAREGVSVERYEASRKHWKVSLDAELKRGRTSDVARFDRAYVDAVWSLRGELSPEEYARLLVAQERGSLREVLADTRIPRDAWMPIQRVALCADAAWRARAQEAVLLARAE